jgi:hypothetical protein
VLRGQCGHALEAGGVYGGGGGAGGGEDVAGTGGADGEGASDGGVGGIAAVEAVGPVGRSAGEVDEDAVEAIAGREPFLKKGFPPPQVPTLRRLLKLAFGARRAVSAEGRQSGRRRGWLRGSGGASGPGRLGADLGVFGESKNERRSRKPNDRACVAISTYQATGYVTFWGRGGHGAATWLGAVGCSGRWGCGGGGCRRRRGGEVAPDDAGLSAWREGADALDAELGGLDAAGRVGRG